jgi:hypothetical protein
LSLGRSGIQVGFHSSQVVVDREAASARTLGEKEPLLRVRIEGELERDGSRENFAHVREDRDRRS